MKDWELARCIAVSLTGGAWSREAIDGALARRLPPPLQRFGPSISSELIDTLPQQYAPPVKLVAAVLAQSIAFQRVSRFCRRHNIRPDTDLTAPVMAPIAAFADLDLPDLPTIDALAEWLGLSVSRLDYLADKHGRHEEHGETAINHYHYIQRQKRSPGIRVIEAPKQMLKSVQSQILRSIVDKVPDHSDAFGFVTGRNCLGGAARHAGEEIVVCFDLKDFFPSIGAGRIFGMFRCLGYPAAIARYLTALCTTATPPRVLERLSFDERTYYRQPHLPQGSPVSPALANKAAFTLDRRLSGLARRIGANYSRYADDLSFSGDRHIVGPLLQVVPQIVRDEGFRLNTSKTRIMPRTARQSITGVVVNEHINVNRKYFDQLKAVIHACGKPDDRRIHDARFRASLFGKIGWVEAVNPRRGRKLWDLLSVTLAKID